MIAVLIIVSILLELAILILGAFLYFRITDKKEVQKSVEVKPVVKKVDAQFIYSTSNVEELPINSGGELIPFDITDKDRELLRQFYSKDD